MFIGLRSLSTVAHFCTFQHSKSWQTFIHSPSTVLGECYDQACWSQKLVQNRFLHLSHWATKSHLPRSWNHVWISCRLVKASVQRSLLSSDPSHTESGYQKVAQRSGQSWAKTGLPGPVSLSPWRKKKKVNRRMDDSLDMLLFFYITLYFCSDPPPPHQHIHSYYLKTSMNFIKRL